MSKVIKLIIGLCAIGIAAVIGTICIIISGSHVSESSLDDSSLGDAFYIETVETTETTTDTSTTETTTSSTTEETTKTEEATSKTTTTVVSYHITNTTTTSTNTTTNTTTTSQTTTVTSSSSTSTDVDGVNPIELKTAQEIAYEVWHGLWGSGEERKQRLEAAGYNYAEVQKWVDELRQEFYTEPTNGMSFVKTFSRGTYYCYGGPRRGGSGRQLISCGSGNGTVKGSIASSYLYRNYGYNYNGKRTMVYLEISGYPSMNGYYYVDDSDAGNPNVIDFFYITSGECAFRNQGVVSVNCYIVTY